MALYFFKRYIDDLNKGVGCMYRLFADDTCQVVKILSAKTVEK